MVTRHEKISFMCKLKYNSAPNMQGQYFSTHSQEEYESMNTTWDCSWVFPKGLSSMSQTYFSFRAVQITNQGNMCNLNLQANIFIFGVSGWEPRYILKN